MPTLFRSSMNGKVVDYVSAKICPACYSDTDARIADMFWRWWTLHTALEFDAEPQNRALVRQFPFLCSWFLISHCVGTPNIAWRSSCMIWHFSTYMLVFFSLTMTVSKLSSMLAPGSISGHQAWIIFVLRICSQEWRQSRDWRKSENSGKRNNQMFE